ncbi:MAG: prevent-host-death protein [Bacillota bacterium]|nr:prevent-host-death protein [Bacillota bacterium]
MPTIRPMADLRDTGKISELCHGKNEPVFITKNGRGHLVVMSMDTYEKQLGLLDVYRKLGAAEKQLEEGVPLLDSSEVFGRLRKKHGK